MAHYHKMLIIRRREFSSSRRPAFALRDSMKNGSVAVVVPASIVVWADGGAANALTGEDVTEAYLKVQSAASRVSHAASETFNAAKEVADQDVHTVKPAVDFVTPYVRQSADYVYKAVFPVAVEHQKQAEVIQSSGYDTKPALEVAKTADSTAGEVQKYIEGAKSSISKHSSKCFVFGSHLCWPRELEPCGFCISFCSRAYLLLPGVPKETSRIRFQQSLGS